MRSLQCSDDHLWACVVAAFVPRLLGESGEPVTVKKPVVEGFDAFVERAEPRLRMALCSGFGKRLGAEATADALAYAWEHWDRVRVMGNPEGYVWKVGRRRAIRLKPKRTLLFADVEFGRELWVEPGLPGALASLSERQRTCVLLLHGFDWTFAEVAEFLGITRSSVQRHNDRGMQSLKRSLKVEV